MFSRRTNWKLTPNAFSEASARLHAAGTPILDLTVSNPTACGFNYDQAAILQSIASTSALDYDPQPLGLPSARRAVADYYLHDHNVHLNPDHLVLTTSTSEAYTYLFRLLCDPADEVLVPTPSYPLFEFLADLADVRLIPYDLHYAGGWLIDFHSLEQAITDRTRSVLVVHPNNPTGSFVQPEELVHLNGLARAHSLAVIADEVFLDYSFDRKSRPSFAANREALTFTLSGLSKISALPQMKLAWIVVSGPDADVRPSLDRLEVIADTYLSVSTPIQQAAPALLAQRHAIQAQIRERAAANLELLKSTLPSSQGTPPAELLHADGGWYAVLRLRSRRSDEETVLQLLETHHVLIHPGHFYGFPAQDYLVLSLITPEAILREALLRIGSDL